MKKIFILSIIMTISFLSNAQNNKIHWMDFEEAVAACQKNPKKLFIDVYTDWCGWCKRMDQTTFSDTVIAKYMNENYYAVKFNAERMDTVTFYEQDFVNVPRADGKKGTHQLAYILLNKKMSYPSFVVMSEDLKLLQSIPGYHDAAQFEPMIHYFAEDAFKTTDWKTYLSSFVSELPAKPTENQNPKQ